MISRRGFLKGCIVSAMAPAFIKLEVLMPPVKEIIVVSSEFDPVFIKLVRRAMPSLIASDLVGVQPMTSANGEIFRLNSHYRPTFERRVKQQILNYIT